MLNIETFGIWYDVDLHLCNVGFLLLEIMPSMSVGCSVWRRKANTAAENGVFYRWTAESDCMAGCLKSTSCVAFDLHPYGCVIHNNADDLETAFSAPGVTQFILNRDCLPTSQLSTGSPVLSTTSASVTISMHFVLFYVFTSISLFIRHGLVTPVSFSLTWPKISLAVHNKSDCQSRMRMSLLKIIEFATSSV